MGDRAGFGAEGQEVRAEASSAGDGERGRRRCWRWRGLSRLATGRRARQEALLAASIAGPATAKEQAMLASEFEAAPASAGAGAFCARRAAGGAACESTGVRLWWAAHGDSDPQRN